MDNDELPIDVELSRDADKIVTATVIRIDCRRCGDFTAGIYRAAVLAHRAHMELVHGAS
jgi:hypothetical protein